jgi:DNA-binding transcriptional LysR family regulator
MPNLTQFRVLIAVAEAGGIRAAADRISRTPSAVSMALKQLEDEVGGALFEGERKVRLTRFGEFVVDHARSLIEHSDRVNRTITAFTQNGVGNVEIAVLPSIALAFLPDALRAFTQDRSAAVVRVRDLDSKAILDAVSRDTIDWGITGYHQLPHIELEPLFSEPLMLVCRSDDPLCEIEGPISWGALVGRPFVGNGTCEIIDTPAFVEIAERQITHARSVMSLLSIVRAGVGITVLPSLSHVGGDDGLRFLPLDDPKAYRKVCLVSRSDRNLSPAAQQFARVMRDIIARRAADYGLELQ